jgi:hypothetical protein
MSWATALSMDDRWCRWARGKRCATCRDRPWRPIRWDQQLARNTSRSATGASPGEGEDREHHRALASAPPGKGDDRETLCGRRLWGARRRISGVPPTAAASSFRQRHGEASSSSSEREVYRGGGIGRELLHFSALSINRYRFSSAAIGRMTTDSQRGEWEWKRIEDKVARVGSKITQACRPGLVTALTAV